MSHLLQPLTTSPLTFPVPQCNSVPSLGAQCALPELQLVTRIPQNWRTTTMDHYYGWSATIAASQKDGQLHMYTWTVKAGHILVIPLKLAQSSSPSSTCSVEIKQIPPSSPQRRCGRAPLLVLTAVSRHVKPPLKPFILLTHRRQLYKLPATRSLPARTPPTTI